MDIWSLLYLVWIVFFLAVELVAVFDAKHGNTLSEKVWRYVTMPDRRRGKRALAWWVWPGRIGVVGLAGWLVFHFLTGV